MLDGKDVEIVEIVAKDGKATAKQIARKLGVPPTTAHNRLKRLEAGGVITGYRASVDERKLGNTIRAFVAITVSYSLPSGKKISQEELARRIRKLAGVKAAYLLTGETDILAEVSVKDTDALNEFVVRKLRALDGVDKVKTSIVLSEA